MKNIIQTALLILLFAPVITGATTVTYQLDQEAVHGLSQSGTLLITLDDEGAPGSINFHLELLDDSLVTNRGVGIKAIAFNGPGLGMSDIDGLGGWRISNNRSAGKVGKFSNILTGKGRAGQSSISFSISGILNDQIEDYASAGKNDYLFAVSIAGLSKAKSSKPTWFPVSSEYLLSANVMPEPQVVVPLPPSLWLLGSGLVGIVGVARRRSELRVSKCK
jgi:hypothetical protein